LVGVLGEATFKGAEREVGGLERCEQRRRCGDGIYMGYRRLGKGFNLNKHMGVAR